MATPYTQAWHTDACERKNERTDTKDGYRRFFCVTHNQWAAEKPISKVITYTYEDGSVLRQTKGMQGI